MADAEGDLVFSGVEDGSPYGLLSMSEPARPKRRSWADDSAHVAGSLLTQSVGAMTEIQAVVQLEGSTQAELEARKVRMRTVLERFRFLAQQMVNGSTTTWSCVAADITPAPSEQDDLHNLEHFKASYILSIPCYPGA